MNCRRKMNRLMTVSIALSMLASFVPVANATGFETAPGAATASRGDQRGVAAIAADFARQRARIETEFAKGEKYNDIRPEDREQVGAALERIQSRLDSAQGVGTLSKSDRMAVFNDQELINTLLTRAAADSRVICRHSITVGTHMTVNHCTSVAERRRHTEQARDGLRMARMQQQPPLSDTTP
jgi:hypothetical protein